jgi:hypothetical protein
MMGALEAKLTNLREQHGESLLTALTILLLIILFVIVPLQATGIVAIQPIAFIAAFALIIGAVVVSGSKTAFALMMVALFINGTAAIHRLFVPSKVDVAAVALGWIIVSTTLGWVVARAVFARGRVSYHRIVGAVFLYLLIALTFAGLFVFVGLAFPKAFSGLEVADSPALAGNLIYFSFVTLTSTGYGDIFPVHPMARSLCNLETIIGQLYPATLLARLVTLELAGTDESRG